MGIEKSRRSFHAPEFIGDAGRYVDKTITSAQLLALNATPITILPAPGAGKAWVIDRVVLTLPYNSVAYAGIAAGEDLAFKYTDAAGTTILTVEATGFLDATANAVRYAPGPTGLQTPTINAAIVLHMLTGEIITGNSPLKIRMYYRAISSLL